MVYEWNPAKARRAHLIKSARASLALFVVAAVSIWIAHVTNVI